MKVILVGLPESGKTTYLGALSHLLTADRQQTALRLAGLAKSESHTSALEERWLACDNVDRTRLKAGDEGAFRVYIGDGITEAEIDLPDLSGEAFRQPASKGLCRPGLFETLVEADGLVLFTSADRAVDDRLLFDASPQYEALDAAFAAEMDAAGLSRDTPNDNVAGVSDERSGLPFNSDDMPEEVLLVELLQQLNRAPLSSRKRGLALVVSAWDVVADGTDPSEWWQQARPMLAQYLRHNPNLWDVQVWGVSALGGGLPAEAERLRNFIEPSERIKVVGPSTFDHDLTAPIAWLLERSALKQR